MYCFILEQWLTVFRLIFFEVRLTVMLLDKLNLFKKDSMNSRFYSHASPEGDMQITQVNVNSR